MVRNRVRNGRSRSSKVVDFGTNRKRVRDFLLVITSNIGPILLRFWDIAGFLLKTTLTPIPPEFWGVPFAEPVAWYGESTTAGWTQTLA